jgi:putative membrane protein
MRSLVSLFAVGALISLPAFAQLKSDQNIDNADAAAMKQLAQANINEVEAGKVAASKAQSPDVKRFAQKMIDDHTQMLNDLKTLARQKSVALPDSVSLKDQAEIKMMERASGADFDKKYMEKMAKEHESDLIEVQNLAAKAKDADFRAAMQRASGKISEHLRIAQRIAGASAAGSTGPSTPSNSTTTPAPGSTTSPSAQQINPGINYSK